MISRKKISKCITSEHRILQCVVTLLDFVSELLQQLVSALIPLVFAAVVVLQSHLGIVEGGSTQGTVSVWVRQINIRAGDSRGSFGVWGLHTPLLR